MPFLSLWRQSAFHIMLHVKTNILIMLLHPRFTPTFFPSWAGGSWGLMCCLFSHVSKPQKRQRQPRTVGSEVQHKIQRCFSIFLHSSLSLSLLTHTFSHTCAHSCWTAVWSMKREKGSNLVAYVSDMYLCHTYTLWGEMLLFTDKKPQRSLP